MLGVETLLDLGTPRRIDRALGTLHPQLVALPLVATVGKSLNPPVVVGDPILLEPRVTGSRELPVHAREPLQIGLAAEHGRPVLVDDVTGEQPERGRHTRMRRDNHPRHVLVAPRCRSQTGGRRRRLRQA